MVDIEVLSRTQRIIVAQGPSIKIVNDGPVVGNSVVRVVDSGPPGPPGINGINGISGGRRWYGEGPPGTIVGAAPNDEYLDLLTGDLYVLQ